MVDLVELNLCVIGAASGDLAVAAGAARMIAHASRNRQARRRQLLHSGALEERTRRVVRFLRRLG